jgi:hypothetical protein
MTEDDLMDIAQMLQRCVEPGSAWLLLAAPPHESHAAGECPLMAVTNMGKQDAVAVLLGAVAMYGQGTHGPMIVRPVEKVN